MRNKNVEQMYSYASFIHNYLRSLRENKKNHFNRKFMFSLNVTMTSVGHATADTQYNGERIEILKTDKSKTTEQCLEKVLEIKIKCYII